MARRVSHLRWTGTMAMATLRGFCILLLCAIGPACATNTYWAVVLEDGTLSRGKDVVSTLRLTEGQYEVIFNLDVWNCAYVATVGGRSAVFGQVGVGPRFTNTNGVFVLTSDSGGTIVDLPFHVVVFCPA